MGLSTPNSGPPRDRRFSPPVALWCPYCHQSFVGTVDRVTGRFVHGSCPVGRLDLAQIRRLAADQWFWARFLDRLGIALPPEAAHRLDDRQPSRQAGQGSKAST